MQDVVSILKTLILANMCDVRDHQKLIALMEDIDGNLNGRTILSLLRETESNIANFQARISRARNNLHSSTSFPSLSSTTFDATKRMISKYENILQAQHDLRNYLNSRIDLYNTIEHQSRLLFREAAELRIEAMNGFEMVNEAATGLPNSFHHSGLSAWRTNIQTKKDSYNDVKVKAANEILNLIRKQGIPFPKGWSAADKRDFALKYLAEMQLYF